jgi:hypothetical protein
VSGISEIIFNRKNVVSSDKILNDAELSQVARRYSNYATSDLSFGTVADYVDSYNTLGELSYYMKDLKDIQRCWILKVILAKFPPGSRLIEIGAGEPMIAHLLHRAGYHVTVVDPYEGAGNGPTQVERFKHEFQGVDFVVELFNRDTKGLEEQAYDGCYSISVIEHIPLEFLGGVFEGVKRFVKPDGLSVHAIDHVVLGAGDTYHVEMLKTVARAHGWDPRRIDELLERAAGDPETYYLSAEAHNRWRGSTPYAQFPMRRCISVQMVQTVSAMA